MLLSVVIILFAALWFTNLFDQREDEVNWKEFVSLIEGGEAKDIVVTQNKAVPTGRVEFTVNGKEGKELRYLYVSDVNEIQNYLKENKLDYEMPDVPQDNWFATTILPVLLTAGAILVIFYLMNRQGGGANSKAMSFGKSRARLSTEIL